MGTGLKGLSPGAPGNKSKKLSIETVQDTLCEGSHVCFLGRNLDGGSVYTLCIFMRFYSKILYGIIISSQAHNHAKHGPDLLDQFKLELILLYTIGKRILTGIFIIVDLLEYRFIHFTLL